MDSILDSTKKVLGIDSSYKAFDTDIIMHINTVFTTLHQLGVGPATGFMIESADENWSDFLDGAIPLNSVKTLVYLKVKLLFDPPSTSFAIDAMKKQIEELEWRINVHREEATHPWVDPQMSS